MVCLDKWFLHGQELEPAADHAGGLHQAFGQGEVRLTSSIHGTHVRWSVFAPNWTSLYTLAGTLTNYPAPYYLNYFIAGWVEESFAQARPAADRIEQVVAKSDLRLRQSVFVRPADPRGRAVPHILRCAWRDGSIAADFAVECVSENGREEFRVAHVGPRSTIARLFGTAPVSFPCVNGGAYDRTVAAAYREVLETGRPRYDHVYASVPSPGHDQVWIPYQRVILPARGGRSAFAVQVVTEIAPVDIRII